MYVLNFSTHTQFEFQPNFNSFNKNISFLVKFYCVLNIIFNRFLNSDNEIIIRFSLLRLVKYCLEMIFVQA